MFEDIVNAIANNDVLSTGLKDAFLSFMQTTSDAADQLNSLFGNGLTRLNVKIYSGGIVAGTGTDPWLDSTTFSGVFLLFPAILIGNTGTTSYYFGAMNSGVLQFGVTTTGDVYAVSGATTINSYGITILGTLTALLFRATVGSNTRELSMSLQSNATADTPIGGMYYADPTPNTNLITNNPGFESGDTSNWTTTGSIWSVVSTHAKSGTYSLQAASGVGTIKNDRVAVTAGQPYVAAGWVDVNSTPVMYLRFFDASTNGNQVGSSVPLSRTAAAVVNNFRQWATGSTVAPAGATYAEVYISAPGVPISGGWFDDFSISLSPTARSLTFEPNLTYRVNGARLDFQFARHNMQVNRRVTGTTNATAVGPNFVIPGNTISTHQSLRITIKGYASNNSGGARTLTLNGFLGAGAVGSSSAATINNATETSFEYTFHIRANPNGYTTASSAYNDFGTVAGFVWDETRVFDTATGTNRGGGVSGGADLTVDNNLSFTVQLNSALGTYGAWFESVVVEVIPETNLSGLDRVWRIALTPSIATDTYLNSASPTTNFVGNTVIASGESNTGAAVFRSLIPFPKPTLPSGYVISAVYLYLTINANASSNARDTSLYRVLVDWDPTTATWNSRGTTPGNWNTAGLGSGTDYAATPLATTSIASAPAAGTVYTFSIDVTEFKKMIDGTYSNFGFLLKGATENNDQHNWYSGDNASVGPATPTLEIVYTVAPTGNE